MDVRRRDALLSGIAAVIAAAAAPTLMPAGAAAAAVPEAAASAVAAVGTAAAAAVASATGYSLYEDPVEGFSLQIPSAWQAGSGQAAGGSAFRGATGARRTLAWYPSPELARGTNLTLVVTNVSGEFTGLGSFGSVTAFGEHLVNSMDQSFKLRSPSWARGKDPIQVAKLLDADQVKGNYFIEYTVSNPVEGNKHMLSLVSLGYTGVYRRLYTLTAQCMEEDLATYRPQMDAMLRSFVPPKSMPA